jgi:hypothetical protein
VGIVSRNPHHSLLRPKYMNIILSYNLHHSVVKPFCTTEFTLFQFAISLGPCLLVHCAAVNIMVLPTTFIQVLKMFSSSSGKAHLTKTFLMDQNSSYASLHKMVRDSCYIRYIPVFFPSISLPLPYSLITLLQFTRFDNSFLPNSTTAQGGP